MNTTLRSLIDGRISKFVRWGLTVWIALLGCLMFMMSNYPKERWAAAVVIIVFLGVFYKMQMSGLRCPKCGVSLMSLCWYPRLKFPLRFPEEFKFCPGCGANLDTPIDERRA